MYYHYHICFQRYEIKSFRRSGGWKEGTIRFRLPPTFQPKSGRQCTDHHEDFWSDAVGVDDTEELGRFLEFLRFLFEMILRWMESGG